MVYSARCKWENEPNLRALVRHDMGLVLADCDNERNAIGQQIAALAKEKGGGAAAVAARKKQGEMLSARRDALADLPPKVLGAYGVKFGGRWDSPIAKDITGDVGPQPPTTERSESFGGTGSAVGSDLSWAEYGTDDWDRASGEARRITTTTAASSRTCRCEDALSSADHESKTTIGSYSFSTANGQPGAVTRHGADGGNYYAGLTDSTSWFHYKVVSGTGSTMASGGAGSVTTSAGRVIEHSSSGATQVFIYFGTQLSSLTDTSHTSAVKAGIYGMKSSSSNTVQIASWFARDLFAPRRPVFMTF
jgi:hypothetical protein